MTHELTLEKKYFDDIISDKMKFLPCKDMGFQIGDELHIKEHLPGEWEERGIYLPGDSEKETGWNTHLRVTFIFDDSKLGMAPGYVILGIEKVL